MPLRITGSAYLRDERRNTNTEVNVETVANFLSRALRNLMPPIMGCLVVFVLLRGGLSFLAEGKDLDGLGDRSLHYPIDIDTRDVDGVGRKATDGTGEGLLRLWSRSRASGTYTISSASTIVSFALRAMTAL